MLILDPERIPVISTDAHLPAVPAERLAPQALRQRFALPPPWQPETMGDGRVLPRVSADAGVLVPLILRPVEQGGVHVLLTRRTDGLRHHAGQIAFPGGRREASDRDVIATALREAQEEVGLHSEHVDVIGCLPVYTTITAFTVTPVVGFVPDGLRWQLDPNEVAETFEVPLSHLMNPAGHQRHRTEIEAIRREFLSMPWHDGARRYFIWGATAAMLRNLYRLLSA